MTRSAALAGLALGISIALKLLAVAIVLLTPPGGQADDRLGFLIWAPGVLAFAVVGAVVAARRPENAVGWIFLGIGTVEPFAMFAESYARLGAVVSPGSLPAAAEVGLLGAAFNETALAGILLIILLFPTGHLPSPRWRPAIGLVICWIVVDVMARLVAPGPIGSSVAIQNPLAAPGLAGQLAVEARRLTEVVAPVLVLLVAPALVVRWRGAQSVERAQLKWFAFAVAVLVVMVIAIVPIWDAGAIPRSLDLAFTLLLVSIVGAIPVSAGIAILRYRLYDIDVVIRRTLVYGVVTAVLGAVYVGLVLGLQGLLSALTGANTVAVALSTLAVAALFGPVRRRVQSAVDRRFYRSRYDAGRTVEAFAARLRGEVELEAVGEALVSVAAGSVRPASASVWVRRVRAS